MRVTFLVFAVLPLDALSGAAGEFFESKVRPVLATHCWNCHGKAAMGGLRLDSREGMLKGGKSGAVIVPGNPDSSVLVQAVRRTHASLKMPPSGALGEGDVAALAEWVKSGAVWPETPAAAPVRGGAYWAFQPLAKTPKTDIDRMITARLEKAGIKPVRQAAKATLLRRAAIDLTGLPPSPEETSAFLADNSPQAFEKVVDRLLASPHYGERWGRHWLDLARYSDGLLAAGVDTPLPNSWRYRDWVVDALNKDMPYDTFIKAQIAADLMPASERAALLGGLGFQALGGSNAHDQTDTTFKVFLGMTVGCAQCHDHKYDPIPTRDYYSLYGVFRSTQGHQWPLVGEAEVERYTAQKKKVDALKEIIDDFLVAEQKQLVDVLARHTARYMVTSWKIGKKLYPGVQQAAAAERLDAETLERWVKYLADPNKEHPYLKPWFDAVAGNPEEAAVRKAAADFQKFTLELLAESREVEDKNYVAFGGRKGQKDERTRQYTNIVSLETLKFYQWRELANGPYNIDGHRVPAGVYYYSAKEIERFLGGHAKDHLVQLRAELAELEKDLPPMYPFLHGVKEGANPADARIMIRGDAKQLGEVAPRRFLSALSEGEASRFAQGSGRLELANAIAAHPLAARVIVNRLWQHHFGQGIVRTPSNFGANGEGATHPELLDYLAQRLIDARWSLKALHREMMLTAAYQRSTETNAAAAEKDPDNRLLWRAHLRHRLDLESLRDSVLAVTGKLDRTLGGAPRPIEAGNTRRSLYLTVSRTRLDGSMALFDFPDANATAEKRAVTAGPLQGLFFLNSEFVEQASRDLDARLAKEGSGAEPRIRRAYQLLYAREPAPKELALGVEFVGSGANAWPRYLQALLGSAEFTSLN